MKRTSFYGNILTMTPAQRASQSRTGIESNGVTSGGTRKTCPNRSVEWRWRWAIKSRCCSRRSSEEKSGEVMIFNVATANAFHLFRWRFRRARVRAFVLFVRSRRRQRHMKTVMFLLCLSLLSLLLFSCFNEINAEHMWAAARRMTAIVWSDYDMAHFSLFRVLARVQTPVDEAKLEFFIFRLNNHHYLKSQRAHPEWHKTNIDSLNRCCTAHTHSDRTTWKFKLDLCRWMNSHSMSCAMQWRTKQTNISNAQQRRWCKSQWLWNDDYYASMPIEF